MVDENLISTWHYLRHIPRISGTADAEVVWIKSLITRATILGTGYNTYLHSSITLLSLQSAGGHCVHWTRYHLNKSSHHIRGT